MRADSSILAPSNLQLASELEVLRSLRVEHPAWLEALDEVSDLVNFSSTCSEGSGLMIVGESGAGKTSLLRAIESELPPRSEEPHRTVIPCLYASVPPRPTIKITAKAILAALGDPLSSVNVQDTGALSRRVLKLMRGCGTRVVLIDEMNHLVEGRRSDRLEQVADWLKDLIETSKVPFVLAGLPSATAVLDANEQLRRRIKGPFELSVVETPGGKLRLLVLQSVLKTICGQVRILGGTDLSDVEMAKRVYYATDGRLGYLMKLLDASVRLLYREDCMAADHSILARAFRKEIWRAPKPGLNPFEGDFSWRRLDRVGEPFASGRRKKSGG